MESIPTVVETPAEALARLIHERGYRKQFVAESVGVHVSSLSHYMAERHQIPKRVIVNLARFFDVPAETFLPAPEDR